MMYFVVLQAIMCLVLNSCLDSATKDAVLIHREVSGKTFVLESKEDKYVKVTYGNKEYELIRRNHDLVSDYDVEIREDKIYYYFTYAYYNNWCLAYGVIDAKSNIVQSEECDKRYQWEIFGTTPSNSIRNGLVILDVYMETEIGAPDLTSKISYLNLNNGHLEFSEMSGMIPSYFRDGIVYTSDSYENHSWIVYNDGSEIYNILDVGGFPFERTIQAEDQGVLILHYIDRIETISYFKFVNNEFVNISNHYINDAIFYDSMVCEDKVYFIYTRGNQNVLSSHIIDMSSDKAEPIDLEGAKLIAPAVDSTGACRVYVNGPPSLEGLRRVSDL